MCVNKLEEKFHLWGSFFVSSSSALSRRNISGGGVCVRTHRTPVPAYALANTNVVCRNCAERNSNVVKKVAKTREKFGWTKAELVEQKGSTSFKRICRPKITRETSNFESVVQEMMVLTSASKAEIENQSFSRFSFTP